MSRGHHAREMRTDSPEKRETSSMPTAANGSVTARNVSGASSVTPIFRIGQLQPQTSVRTRIGNAARAIGCDDRGMDAMLSLMPLEKPFAPVLVD